MDYRALGRSGFKVPVLSFGTGTFAGSNDFFRAWGGSDQKEASRLVGICLDAGVTMFDSADVYSAGVAEEMLGHAIKGRRAEIIISTKASLRMGPGPNDLGNTRHHLIRSCEASLRRLGTDYIDLYQTHAFDALTACEETMSALDTLVRSGKVRYIGCSNLYRVVDALDQVAAETGKTVAQVALNWVAHRPTVASVIVGARNEEQLTQNLGALGWRLTAAQNETLEAASAVPMPYPYWHTRATARERNPPPSCA